MSTATTSSAGPSSQRAARNAEARSTQPLQPGDLPDPLAEVDASATIAPGSSVDADELISQLADQKIHQLLDEAQVEDLSRLESAIQSAQSTRDDLPTPAASVDSSTDGIRPGDEVKALAEIATNAVEGPVESLAASPVETPATPLAEVEPQIQSVVESTASETEALTEARADEADGATVATDFNVATDPTVTDDAAVTDQAVGADEAIVTDEAMVADEVIVADEPEVAGEPSVASELAAELELDDAQHARTPHVEADQQSAVAPTATRASEPAPVEPIDRAEQVEQVAQVEQIDSSESQPTDSTVADSQTADSPEPAAPASHAKPHPPVSHQSPALARVTSRLTALGVTSLTLVNRPFAKLSDNTRELIGSIAIITLVNAMSILLYLMIFGRS
jgi:hypothetical protein